VKFLSAARWLLLPWLCLGLAGCFPTSTNPLDEQKDPHFLLGQDRVNSKDFKGAIESFEKSLEANPRSASAHFELGWLYEEKDPNPAAAIYHYESFLKLRPSSDKVDIVKPRIIACKQEMAKSVLISLGTQTTQRDLEKLRVELEKTLVENNQLRAQLVQAQQQLAVFQAQSQAARTPVTSTPLVPTAPRSNSLTTTTPAAETPRPVASSSNAPAKASAPTASRKHNVQSGENPVAIARKYNVKLDALLSANPGLDPKRLKIGQTINIPTP
jgi:LysM repeat protein